MDEYRQRRETAAALQELGVEPGRVWLHYLSLGGTLDWEPIATYLAGDGPLPAPERDLIACTVNDLTRELRGGPL